MGWNDHVQWEIMETVEAMEDEGYIVDEDVVELVKEIIGENGHYFFGWQTLSPLHKLIYATKLEPLMAQYHADHEND